MASYIVTTLADENDAGATVATPGGAGLSLREAITLANADAAADTITFSLGGTITLGGTQLSISNPLTIDGDNNNDGTPEITIDANGLSGIFSLSTTSPVSLKGLVLTDAASLAAVSGSSANLTIDTSIITGNAAGGIQLSDTATVSVSKSTISDNSAGLSGGGISIATAAITLTDSTVSGNSAEFGGGISITSGTITLTNTTVSGNQAGTGAGGISATSGTITATNSTLSGNSAGLIGGGIALTVGTIALIDSIVLGNSAPYSGEISGSVANTNSIVGGTPADVFASIDVTTPSGVGGLLADNGGPVKTIALKASATNPALDKGNASSVTPDARGIATYDLAAVANTNGNARDLGAFELVPTRSLNVTTLLDVVNELDGLTSLREAIAFANDVTAGTLANGDADDDGFANDTITFDSALAGGTITLALGQLEATAAVTIDGDIDDNATADITVDANNASRVLNTTATTILLGLILENGSVSGRGGAVNAAAALTVNYSTVRNSHSSGISAFGGGIYAVGALSAFGSVITGNSASGFFSSGGGIAGTNTVSLIRTTVSGNSTDGDNGDGGGVISGSTLTLNDSVVTGNSTTGTHARGGGVWGQNPMTVTNSTVSGNSTGGTNSSGGGIFGNGAVTLVNSTVSGNSTGGVNADGGGIYTNTTATLTNTTVSGNKTKGDNAQGGGIFGDDVELNNSTITGNSTAGSAAEGGGYMAITTHTLKNSIITGNVTSFAGLDFDNTKSGGGLVSLTLIGNDATTLFAQTANVIDANGVDTEVKAGVLADNGGPVQTVALLTSESNPALDWADGSSVSPDARGQATFDFPSIPNSNGSARDLGAFELDYRFASRAVGTETRSLVVTTLDDVLDPYDNLTSLREALDFANDPATDGGSGDADGDTFANDTITFDPSLAGGTITLGGSQLEVTAAVTIDGDIDDDNAPNITIDANSASRVIQTSADTTLIGLTITGGRTAASVEGGGGIRATGAATLTIVDSVITGNRTEINNSQGGGIFAKALVSLTNSVVSGNSTLDHKSSGGGIYSDGDITLTDSTVSGNHTDAANGGGGGLWSEQGAITLTRSTISNNYTSGSSSEGGGIGAFGLVTVTDSTVSGNSTAGLESHGGGIASALGITLANSTVSTNSTAGLNALGGGLFSFTTITLTNTTISGNNTKSDGAEGGGIHGDTVTLYNSTVSGNSTAGSAAHGGGIFAATSITATNSLLAGNVTTGSGAGDEFGGPAPLISDNSRVRTISLVDAGDVFAQTANIIDANGLDSGVKAGVLADNGGPVKTIALKASAANPALDKGNASSVTPDARGLANFDFPSIANSNGSARDLGAFELQYAEAAAAPGTETRSLVVTILGDVLDPYDNKTSLREALEFANDPTVGGTGDADGVNGAVDTITFDPALSGGKITLAHGELLATAPVTIDGDIDNDNTPDITIDAHEASRVIRLDSTANLRGLILENGKTTGMNKSGGAVRGTTLTLEDSIVRGSSTTDANAQGGGVYSNSSLTLVRTTVTGNSTNGANANGGGVSANFTLTLTQSTVSGNSTTQSGSYGGGIFASTLTANDSTISGNSTEGSFAQGGGAFGFTVTLTNTTVSGNSTVGFASHGGGISSQDATLTNSTVTGNSIAGIGTRGGGIYVAGPLKVFDSLILGNVRSNAGATVNNLFSTTTVTTSHSLFTGDASLVFATTVNVIDGNGIDTGIAGGVLADNGGPVRTIALKMDAANPAIDKSGAGAPADDARGEAKHDFIGLPNTNGNSRDLGAFELLPDLLADTPSVTNATTNEDIQSSSGLVISRNLLDGIEVTHFKITGITNGKLFLNNGSAQINNGDFITFAQANAGLKFSPTPDFHGAGSFNVQASLSASDAGLGGGLAPATITVTPVNDAPVAPATNIVDTDENALSLPVVIGASDVDGDVLTYSLKPGAAPTKGAVLFTGDTFVFDPVSDIDGTDSFTILISDGKGGVAEQVVSVIILPAPEGPADGGFGGGGHDIGGSGGGTGGGSGGGTGGSGGSGSSNRSPVIAPVDPVKTLGDPVAIQVAASDADGDALAYSATNGAHGSVTGGAGGAFVYRPAGGFAGTDSFTVTVSDGKGAAASRSISVTVIDLPETSDWTIVAPTGHVSEIGGTGNYAGTSGFQQVSVLDLPGLITFDASSATARLASLFVPVGTQTYGPVPGGTGSEVIGTNAAERVSLAADANVVLEASFVRGNDTVAILGASTGFAIASSVAGLAITSASGAHIRIPSFAPGGGLTLEFADRTLQLTTTDGVIFRLGGQTVTDAPLMIGSGLPVTGSSTGALVYRGGDLIELHGDADAWCVTLLDGKVLLTDGDTHLLLPVGSSGVLLAFDDGLRTLAFDPHTQDYMIGNQAIGDGLDGIAAPAQALALPGGGNPAVEALLQLEAGGEVTAGGRFAVEGTADAEQVSLLHGQFAFDDTFGHGNDTLVFDAATSAFTAARDSASAVLDSATLDAKIPGGASGTTLAFTNDSRDLVYLIEADTMTIGTQIIGATQAPLTFA